ncbi:ribonuclease P protein component [Pseudonocardia eucalypti]|uniref:Ribonuclease P protein component n=1 Tax=Pseudonocardia eucalypti TaxID=648755 RepID=A0ABP9PHN2_9PSEU|nr:ribonuclease P protein component [Pseudonocardia eucalypti]
MLPATARLTHRDDFAAVLRKGRRAGRRHLVMHVLAPAVDAAVGEDSAGIGVRVGFVVSKAVGGSVVRHRVSRQLRHVLRDRLDRFPAGARVVVRALPRSASAHSSRLGADVDDALHLLGLPGTPAGSGAGSQ